jgi:hypothetical protein
MKVTTNWFECDSWWTFRHYTSLPVVPVTEHIPLDLKIYTEQFWFRYFSVNLDTKEQTSMKTAVFWVVSPCSLVEVYQRFRGSCCLHHQGDRGKLLPDYTVLQPRRQQSSYPPPWEPQILQTSINLKKKLDLMLLAVFWEHMADSGYWFYCVVSLHTRCNDAPSYSGQCLFTVPPHLPLSCQQTVL